MRSCKQLCSHDIFSASMQCHRHPRQTACGGEGGIEDSMRYSVRHVCGCVRHRQHDESSVGGATSRRLRISGAAVVCLGACASHQTGQRDYPGSGGCGCCSAGGSTSMSTSGGGSGAGLLPASCCPSSGCCHAPPSAAAEVFSGSCSGGAEPPASDTGSGGGVTPPAAVRGLCLELQLLSPQFSFTKMASMPQPPPAGATAEEHRESSFLNICVSVCTSSCPQVHTGAGHCRQRRRHSGRQRRRRRRRCTAGWCGQRVAAPRYWRRSSAA